ncbi:MAG: DUF6600 domain-containing protein [Polyangiaceae bacterium]
MSRLQGVVSVSAILGALALLAGCGSMSDFDRPVVPAQPAPPPPPPAAQVEIPDQTPPPDEYADTDPNAINDFREPLAPYGTWVDDSAYGTVWVPNASVVGDDFAPYVSSGHWAVDDNDDYIWVSDHDESVGWIVYHYGRWVYVSDRGWCWIPGRRYAPAWVVWRVGDPGYDYVGWAPMPPAYGWHSGVVFWFDVVPPAPYVFVDRTYVFYPGVRTYVVTGDRVTVVAQGTRPYGHPGGHGHSYYATPSHGPTPKSGHIPSSSWPTSHASVGSKQASYAHPSAMGRTPAPRPSTRKPASAGELSGNRHAVHERPAGSGSSRSQENPTSRGSYGVSRGSAPSAPSRNAVCSGRATKCPDCAASRCTTLSSRCAPVCTSVSTGSCRASRSCSRATSFGTRCATCSASFFSACRSVARGRGPTSLINP